MTATPKDLHDILQKLRYETTVLQSQITIALNTLSSLNLPNPDAHTHQCPHDGLKFTSHARLKEHAWNVHGTSGPNV